MADSVKATVLTTHIEWDKYNEDWLLYADAYYGEGGFNGGGYLTPHPLEVDEITDEPTASYLKRQELSWYLNYAALAIDSKHSHLFKRPISRTSTNKDVMEWMKNVDRRGTSYDEFLRDAQKEAQIFGHVFIFMDRYVPSDLKQREANGGQITKADANAANIRPYVYTVTPLEVVDWAMDRNGNFEWIKIQKNLLKWKGLPIGQSDPFVSGELRKFIEIWTRTERVLYDVTDSDKEFVEEQDTHGLGIVPCQILYSSKGKNRELSGRSVIDKIAPAGRRLYNASSELDEWLRNQAFSVLTIPIMVGEDKLPESGQMGVGTQRALPYNAKANRGPEFIAADASHAQAYETRIASIIEEIHRHAHLQFKGGVVQSGTSWAFDWEEVNNVLMGQAGQLKESDNKLVRLWFMWEDKTVPEPLPYQTEYPETFSYSDMETDMAILRDFLLIVDTYPSVTFVREFLKHYSQRMLPNMDTETQETVNSEIDKWEPQPEINTPESNFSRWTQGQGQSSRLRVMKGKEVPPSDSTGKDNSGETINP